MSQETPTSTTEAQIKDKRRTSSFWLLPFIALAIAGWLIWGGYRGQGNTVTIGFMSADGIVPGHTPVRYRGIEVGTVQDISLNDGLRKIEVKISIESDMKDALREKTQFWLVTLRASLASISGLDALVDGNYIGVMPDKSKKQDHFIALGTQPKYRLNNGNLTIHLQTPDFGSLDSGSLIHFCKIPAGKVYGYAISPNEQGVMIGVLIERRFTDLVKKGNRLWNTSGVNANISVSDTKVKPESLAALINGVITFDSPEESRPAEAEDTFGLYEDLTHSQRDVIIKLELPSGAGLTADSTPLMYRRLEVGQLAKLNSNSGDKVTGETTVDPSVVTLFRENARIELYNPKLSFNDTNLGALLTGKIFELIPGDDGPCRELVIMPGERALLHEPDVPTLTLTAPESYGIDTGQPLILHDVQVGQIIDRKLTSKGVTFTIAIGPQHRELVKGDSKFIVNSRVDIKVELGGVEFLGASASEWINDGIRILPGDKGGVKASYPLYANLGKALGDSLGDLPTTTVSLSTGTLPGVQAGPVVLYRKFEVGEVITIRPRANAFDIDLHIKPEYRSLLTSNSVFWAEGGAKVQLNSSGLTVQASPLSRTLEGAISFDNLSGASASRRKGDKRILYASGTAARAVGGQIALHAFDAGKLVVGMPIRYLGIDIGQIQTLDLITARNKTRAKAILYPEYIQAFACGGTHFSVVTPQVSAADVEHLDTILQSYINAEPDRGNPRRDFGLREATITDSCYLNGLSIITEAPEAGPLGIDTPVLFRSLGVGTVIGMTLGTLSDRVMITVCISKRYQHLVRNNSVFWLASGYSLGFDPVGGIVGTGTFNQLTCSDTAFATPPGTPLVPKAREDKHSLLQESGPKERCERGTALPK